MNKIVSFGVGAKSPFGILREGAALMVGPAGIDLLLSIRSPSEREISMVKTAPMKGGLARIDGIATALLVWRFDGGKPLIMDTPLNICIDPRPEMWRIPDREAHEHFLMNVMLQDGEGTLRASRVVTIPPKLMAAIELQLGCQVMLSAMDMWHAGMYDAEIAALYRRWPTTKAAMRDAFVAKLGR